MKKLLFITMIFVGFGLSAQEVQYDYKKHGSTLDTFTISSVDTSWVFYTTTQYSGTVQFYWTEFVGTLDCAFKLQQSSDEGVNWVDMNIASYTPTDTVGAQAFHITAGTGTDYDQVRLFFDRNSVSAGKVILSVRLNKIK
jgi:uncharacterized protein Usg